MKIGYVMSPGRGDVDRVLGRFAETLMARGVAVAGVVQTNTDCGPARACDMDVEVLPSGPVLRISQDLGPGSRGCRLNPDALEQAVGLVGQRLTGDTRLLVVNKFGKQESEGRGFREVIGAALARDIPVVVGLNGLNRAAFEDFCGGMAEALTPELAALMDWFDAAPEPVA
jgi:nucleoside-triphosphatase THEP1